MIWPSEGNSRYRTTLFSCVIAWPSASWGNGEKIAAPLEKVTSGASSLVKRYAMIFAAMSIFVDFAFDQASREVNGVYWASGSRA